MYSFHVNWKTTSIQTPLPHVQAQVNNGGSVNYAAACSKAHQLLPAAQKVLKSWL